MKYPSVLGALCVFGASLCLPMASRADTFSYDDSGWLTGVGQANGLTHTYGYDNEGNVLTGISSGGDAAPGGGAGNGIADWWENFYFGTTGIDPLASAAGDGVSNLTKFALGLNPLVPIANPLVSLTQQVFTDGLTYNYLTFVRAKGSAGMTSLQQSTDGTNWSSGASFFQQVGSATDLGNGTEQVTFRNLTSLPAGSALSFRLATDGGSPSLVAYNTINSAPGVPSLPWWAALALLVVLPLMAARFLGLRRAGAAIGLFFVVANAQAELGAGWYVSPRSESPGQRALASQKPAAALRLGGIQSFSLVTGPTATAATPELQAVATGLNNDPVAIYNYVRNKIRFQPYRGSCKGAHTTFLDEAGNDMDQASLLIALLNAAGFANTSYVYGQIAVPEAISDGYDLSHWLGCSPFRVPWVLDYAATPGMTFFDFGALRVWFFDHVWVRVIVGGTSYDLSPSFKTSELFAGIDARTISGYSRSQLLTDAGGITTTNSIRSLLRSAVESRLAQYSGTLRSYIATNAFDATMPEVLGGAGKIIERNATSLADAASMLDELVPDVITTYAFLPSQYQATMRVQIGTQIDATFNSDALQSRRLSVVFSGINAQLWLEDTLIAAETNGNGTTANIKLSVTHPDTTLSKVLPGSDYLRTGKYDLSYSFYPNPHSNGQIDASMRKMQNYLSLGLTDSSRQVQTEALRGLGLKWIRRAALGNEIVSKVNDCYVWTDHVFGFTGQDQGYWVDMPGGQLTTFNDGVTAADLTRSAEVFKASSFVSSAMEHGVIEQNGGSLALSTIKCLVLANDGGQRIFRVTPGNWSNISTQLTNYTTTDKTFLAAYVNAPGNVSLVHLDGLTQLNQWRGYGFAAMGGNFISMLITGGYAGGFASIPGNLSGSTQFTFFLNGSEESLIPTGVPLAKSAEPVNLATGAYTLEATDFSLGDANTPRGLAFSRSYDSSRSFQRSALGNGWRHSCDGRIYLSSDLDAAFGERQPIDGVDTIIGALAIPDFADTADPAKDLMIGVFAANWLVNRITNNAANVQLGEQRQTYISRPNGTWNPPPGSTTAFTGTSGNFVLSPRFGGNVTFNAQNLVSQWRDVDGNTQTYVYNANGRLTTVTDSQARSLSFTYGNSTSTLIQSVSDGTGRSVSYTYNGTNLTGITDVENFTTTLLYDTRNRLTEWKDPTGAFFVRNTYDAQDRVTQQLSQGVANRLWKFLYSPGATREVDPLNNTTTHLFDAKNRRVGIIDPLGNTSSISYDGQNHITKTIDATGRQMTFVYDANQNLTSATDNASKTTNYTYDAALRLWKTTDPTNRVTEFGYDAENHLTSIKDPGNRTTTMAYRPDGRLQQITDPDNKTTLFTTYDQWANPTAITRADGTTTSATYNARGDLLTSTDGRAKTTTFTYDKRRLPTTRTDAASKVSTWTYDSNAHPATATDRNNKTTTTVFDNFGKLQTISAPNTGNITLGYDLRDLRTTTTDGLAHTTTTGFDAASRPITLTDPLSIAVTTKTLDGAGRILTTKDGLNKTTFFGYDSVGRPSYTTDPMGRRVDYTYDFAGRQLTLTNRRVKTFNYGYGPDGLSTTFTYPSGRQSSILNRDPVGRPKTLQKPSGQQTALTYDGMGRTKTQADPAGTITWTYDGEGNPLNVVQGNATITRTFDNLGRILTCTDTSGNTVTYTYDNEGNLATLTYPDNKTVTYTYDGSNRLKTVTDWASRVTTYTYDNAGRLTQTSRPNGTTATFAYDNANRLTSISDTKGATPLWQSTLGYDNAYRLTSLTAAPPTRTYAPPPATMTYDNDNRIVSYNTATVTSDADGNMLIAPVNGTLLGALTWDARNRLTSAGNVTYTYDAENRRISSTKSGQTTSYTWSRGGLDRLLVKTNPDGSITRYIHGLGLIYEETTPSSGPATTSFYHFNWQGSTMALTDAAGNVTSRLSYSPYGEVTIVSGTPNTPFLFNGQFGVMTEPNGLYTMQARFYSPILRRFLSEDPAGFSGGINLFAYTSGDPINLMDPFGLGPVGSDYLQGFGDVWRGYGSAASETVHGLWSMVSDPIGTAQGLAFAATHPVLTAQAVAGSVGGTFQDLGSGDNFISGRATGRVLLFAATIAATYARAGQVAEVANAARAPSTALSTFRQTTAGESFLHYGYAEQAAGFAGGLRPGGFATTASGLTGVEARAGLALPRAVPPNAVYTVTPTPGTTIRVNPVTSPQFGQPGGLPEFQFPLGTGPGTISNPRPIP